LCHNQLKGRPADNLLFPHAPSYSPTVFLLLIPQPRAPTFLCHHISPPPFQHFFLAHPKPSWPFLTLLQSFAASPPPAIPPSRLTMLLPLPPLCSQRFAAVIMRIREPKTTALIFASGKMVGVSLFVRVCVCACVCACVCVCMCVCVCVHMCVQGMCHSQIMYLFGCCDSFCQQLTVE